MNLVLCMAGLYKRFKEAGYKTPKFLLPWQGSVILSALLSEMLKDKTFSHLLLVANQRDEAYLPQLKTILLTFPAIEAEVIFINDTTGQAETAKIACQHLKDKKIADERVIFHNIDTILTARNYREFANLLTTHDGLIDVFISTKPCYSYVEIDENRLVKRMMEKVVISSHATSGLYGFHSYRHYLDFAEQTSYQKEFYISDIYQHMLLKQKKIIVPMSTTQQETLVLGTPAEYEAAVLAVTPC